MNSTPKPENQEKSWHKCVKSVQPHKLERLSSKNQEWWESKFNSLETKSRIPCYKKYKYLREVFSSKEIDEITACGVQILEGSKSDNLIDDVVRTAKAPMPPPKRKKSKLILRAPSIDPNFNPYMDFMNKSKEEACCWHEKPKPILHELPLMERAQLLEDEVTTNFLTNFKKLSTSDEINEETILAIFELLPSFPIRTALAISNKVYGAMPETTTKYLGCPEKNEHNILAHQVRKDINASQMTPVQIAFGEHLPAELRRMPFKENPAVKWVDHSTSHDDLETFADVWKNITDFESTRKFCLYLLDHPEIKPPQFLKREGMLIKKILKKPVFLGDLEKNIENMEKTNYNEQAIDVKNLLRKDHQADNVSSETKSIRTESGGEISDINIMV